MQGRAQLVAHARQEIRLRLVGLVGRRASRLQLVIAGLKRRAQANPFAHIVHGNLDRRRAVEYGPYALHLDMDRRAIHPQHKLLFHRCGGFFNAQQCDPRQGAGAKIRVHPVQYRFGHQLGGVAGAKQAERGRVGIHNSSIAVHHDGCRRPFHHGTVTRLALLHRGLHQPAFADVGQHHTQFVPAGGVRRRRERHLHPELRAVTLYHAQLASLGSAACQQLPAAQVVGVLVFPEDIAADRLVCQCAARGQQQVRRMQIGLQDQPAFADGAITYRRQVIQLEVTRACGLQVVLRTTQLFVLHLQLDLVHAQFMQRAPHCVGRQRLGIAHGGGKAVVGVLFRLPAQRKLARQRPRSVGPRVGGVVAGGLIHGGPWALWRLHRAANPWRVPWWLWHIPARLR